MNKKKNTSDENGTNLINELNKDINNSSENKSILSGIFNTINNNANDDTNDVNNDINKIINDSDYSKFFEDDIKNISTPENFYANIESSYPDKGMQLLAKHFSNIEFFRTNPNIEIILPYALDLSPSRSDDCYLRISLHECPTALIKLVLEESSFYGSELKNSGVYEKTGIHDSKHINIFPLIDYFPELKTLTEKYDHTFKISDFHTDPYLIILTKPIEYRSFFARATNYGIQNLTIRTDKSCNTNINKLYSPLTFMHMLKYAETTGEVKYVTKYFDKYREII